MFLVPSLNGTLARPLAWLLRWRGPARPGGKPCAQGFAETRPMGSEPVYGCGWFDSSHDLMQGLLVQEGIIVTDAAYPASR